MSDLQIVGAEEFGRLATRLKTADKTIQREFSRGLTSATKPFKAAAQRSALAKLPRSGGLASRVAASRFSTRRQNSTKTVGIRIEVRGLSVRAVKEIDEGTVRHPVFGNRAAWAIQSVPRGWFSEPAEQAGPKVRDELGKVMDDVARKLES